MIGVYKIIAIRDRCVDAGLVSSLREEVEVWKTKFQEQMEATAAAAAAPPNGENGDSGANPELEKALQDAAQAQEEASRWKEKAVAAQELEGACLVSRHGDVDC